MGHRPTPAPEPSMLPHGCLLSAFALTFTAIVGGAITGWKWPYVIAMAGVPSICWWCIGKLLIIRFQYAFGKRGILGILVTSDSPVWKSYIQSNWIEKCGDRFVILNASVRKQWNPSPATRLYGYFSPYDTNFCPCIILIRGLRYPLVFRFFYAFRDYKHGNDKALLKLESRLNTELAKHGERISDR